VPSSPAACRHSPLPQLANEKALNLSTVRHFVIDECDKVLEKLGEWVPGLSL
jgi:superfamily II DNA/RNA helicase